MVPRQDPSSVDVLDVTAVVLYGARGCHLCDRARRTLEEVRGEVWFELREIDITGDPELERRYRELLPVVEIDGRRAFVYHVPAERLRQALAHSQTASDRARL